MTFVLFSVLCCCVYGFVLLFLRFLFVVLVVGKQVFRWGHVLLFDTIPIFCGEVFVVFQLHR